MLRLQAFLIRAVATGAARATVFEEHANSPSPLGDPLRISVFGEGSDYPAPLGTRFN